MFILGIQKSLYFKTGRLYWVMDIFVNSIEKKLEYSKIENKNNDINFLQFYSLRMVIKMS
jgi:hypothetical protein